MSFFLIWANAADMLEPAPPFGEDWLVDEDGVYIVDEDGVRMTADEE